MSGPDPDGTPNRGARIQLVMILLVTLLVMAAGVGVVAFPRQFGIPERLPATPAVTGGATPSASEALVR